MKRHLAMLRPLVAALAILLPASIHAQVYPIMEPAKVVGLSKDSIYTSDDVPTSKIDSGHVFLESTADSLNGTLLAAPVKHTLDNSDAAVIKDTVTVKAISRTGRSGTIGVTWQELKQAFGGAVPPDIRFYLRLDKDATTQIYSLKEVALVWREFAH